MNLTIKTKDEALKAIEELKDFIKGQDEEWVTIDYSVIPKETFDKYGVKPFQIMKRMKKTVIKAWGLIDKDSEEDIYVLFSASNEHTFSPLHVFDIRHRKYAIKYKKSWNYEGSNPNAEVVPIEIIIKE